MASLLTGCSPAPKHHGGLAAKSINGNALPPKTIILTYDDGPDEHTLELASFLNASGIHATFFINGRRMCKQMDESGGCVAPRDTHPCADGQSQAFVEHPKFYPESLLDELIDLGHHIGNHSEDHCHLTAERSAANLRFEIESTQDLVDDHVGDGLFLFRAPYGAWDAATNTLAHTSDRLDEVIGPVVWDVDGADYDCWNRHFSVEQCGARYLQRLGERPKRNGIFLMHDRPEYNVGFEGPLLLTQWLVARLREAGYHFADIDIVPDIADQSAGDDSPADDPAGDDSP
jgi:peptidoglycan/xylan/chitin deacetylase (PgdA/CDA1 family)